MLTIFHMVFYVMSWPNKLLQVLAGCCKQTKRDLGHLRQVRNERKVLGIDSVNKVGYMSLKPGKKQLECVGLNRLHHTRFLIDYLR